MGGRHLSIASGCFSAAAAAAATASCGRPSFVVVDHHCKIRSPSKAKLSRTDTWPARPRALIINRRDANSPQIARFTTMFAAEEDEPTANGSIVDPIDLDLIMNEEDSDRLMASSDSSDASVADPKGGRMLEERVINRDRKLSTSGAVQVDDSSAVGVALLSEVKWKAACWEITYMKQDSSEGPTYNGQIGLIRGDRLAASPVPNEPKRRKTTDAVDDLPPPGRWEVTPTTALHNVVDYPDKDEFLLVSKIILPNPTKFVGGLVFDDFRRSLNTADRIELVPADSQFPALEWKSVDVARGQVITEPNNFLTQQHLAFEPVPKDWTGICVGAKIGIVVFRPFDIRPSDTGMSMTDDTLLQMFGEKNSVCVFTGEITKLHNNSARTFEHSINTYRGCSGAIIFLLDKGQPNEDVASHQGKAIGVHVGGKPVTATPQRANLGFLL